MSVRPATHRRQSGFGLILALFMIISLAAIGVYLLTISTAQVEAGVQDEQGARAYQAARTGIEWGAFQLLTPSGSSFASTCKGAGGASSQTLTLAGGLTGFFAVVACLKTGDEMEGANAVRSYRITVTGCNQATCSGAIGPTYVERQLLLTLTVTN